MIQVIRCDLINSGVVNVCTMLLANPNNPLANVDCDGDGQKPMQQSAQTAQIR
ncbi:MAG: hypothetical protein IPJ43_17135 [Saprospiraceae bacterium]|nr:hypothetical protein [Saprospiraceae bacterium]